MRDEPGEGSSEPRADEEEADRDSNEFDSVVTDLEGSGDTSTVAAHDTTTDARDDARDALHEASGDGEAESFSFDEREGRTDDEAEREESGERDGPLGELAASVDDRFERQRIEAIDSETLWEQVREESTLEDEIDGRDETTRDVREVSKRSYCHQCEHFSKPPAVTCTNDGTDIVEQVTLETFRVADCPLVAAEEALEDDR